MKKISMRWIFLVILLFFALLKLNAFGQGYNMGIDITGGEYTVVDSITWHLGEVEEEGDIECEHDWICSGEYDPRPSMGCAVLHGCGSTCSWHWPKKDQICKKCGRIEHWNSVVHSHCHMSERAKKRRAYEDELGKWNNTIGGQPYYINDSLIRLPCIDTIPKPKGTP